MELEHFNDFENSKGKCSACKLKEKAKESVDVSIPGLGRLVDPSYGKKSKFVWLIIVICCSVACVYLTIDRLVHFFNIPLATKVEIKRLHNVTFPAFTICSNYLLTQLKPLLMAKVEEECRERGRNDCDLAGIEKIPFRDFNLTVNDVWKAHSLNNMEIELSMGMDKPIKLRDYLFHNKTSDIFEFTAQDTMFGSCVIIRHIGIVMYASSATRLKVTIYETEINKTGQVTYILIPHNQLDKDLTTFEFILFEYEDFPNGYEFKIKLHEENFSLKNVSHKPCFDEKEEVKRIKKCALDLLRPKYCRLPCYPDSFRECESLHDVQGLNKTEFYSNVEVLRRNCTSRPVCNEVQNIISIDHALDVPNKNTTTIIIRMADDTVDIVEQFVDYSFPDLVSDLFAYWGFFLSLSALVFAEIFEYLFKSIRGCIKKQSSVSNIEKK